MKPTFKLTHKRRAWADPRSNVTLKGTQLHPPAGTSTRYVNELAALTAQMTAQVEREVKRLFESFAADRSMHALDSAALMAMDATLASQSRILMNTLGAKFNDLFAKRAKQIAENMVSGTAAASASNLNSSLAKLSGGLSLKTKIHPPKVVEVYKATIAENVSLIKSIPQQYLQKVEGSVMRSITSGNGLQDLIPALQQYNGITHRRAKNIALDQPFAHDGDRREEVSMASLGRRCAPARGSRRDGRADLQLRRSARDRRADRRARNSRSGPELQMHDVPHLPIRLSAWHTEISPVGSMGWKR
jgi:uncharacterized protein with gpF-like domain